MKSITTVAAALACALALTACGGGGDDSSSTVSQQADEGIWSNLGSGGTGTPYGMQMVILADGSSWGIYGTAQNGGTFNLNGLLHGATSASGNNVSGTYASGTYSGTASAQNKLNLTFTDSSGTLTGANFNLNYDSIYNQPASLSAIAGNYMPIGYGGNGCNIEVPVGGSNGCDGVIYPGGLAISGASLTLDDQNGNVIMTGTIAPHSATVSVFDVSLTTATTGTEWFSGGNTVPAGTTYKGILFQPSSGILVDDIEIIAAAGNNGFFYLGRPLVLTPH